MKHYVTEKTTTFNVAAFQGANTSCVADRAVFARSIDVKFHSSIKLFYSQTVQAVGWRCGWAGNTYSASSSSVNYGKKISGCIL